MEVDDTGMRTSHSSEKLIELIGDCSHDGIDLASALVAMIHLPSARGIGHINEFAVEHSELYADTTAYADSDMIITMTIGHDSTIHSVIGTMLHEVAHLACLSRGEAWDDESREFAQCCHALHNEWNARHAAITSVCANLTGAYVGPYMLDRSLASLPAFKSADVAEAA